MIGRGKPWNLMKCHVKFTEFFLQKTVVPRNRPNSYHLSTNCYKGKYERCGDTQCVGHYRYRPHCQCNQKLEYLQRLYIITHIAYFPKNRHRGILDTPINKRSWTFNIKEENHDKLAEVAFLVINT